MKRTPLTILCTFLISLAVSYSVNSATLPWEFPLPFKRATIQYEISGSEKGSETLYIKDQGKLQAIHHESVSTFFGMETRTHTIEIVTPEWITTYDLEEKVAQKIRNPILIYREKYNSLSPAEKKNVEKNASQLGTAVITNIGGHTKKNAELILGYQCDRTEINGLSTVYTIHNTDIPLLTKSSVMGISSTITAKTVDTKSSISDTYFIGPQDIEVIHDTESEKMMTQMIDATMDKLKQPDGANQFKMSSKNMVPTPQSTPSNSTQSNSDEMTKEMEQGLNILKGLFSQ